MKKAPNCVECDDTGDRDTGGTYPWGWPITVPCDCRAKTIDLDAFMDQILEEDAEIFEILAKDD